jgi:hypothetical protein
MPNRLNAFSPLAAGADELRAIVRDRHAARLAEQAAIKQAEIDAAKAEQQRFSNDIELRKVAVSERVPEKPKKDPIRMTGVADPTGRRVTRFADPETFNTLYEVPEYQAPEQPKLRMIRRADGSEVLVEEKPGLVSAPAPRAPQNPNFSTTTLEDADGNPVLVRVNPDTGDVLPMNTPDGLRPRATGAAGGRGPGGANLSAGQRATLTQVSTARGLLDELKAFDDDPTKRQELETWLGPIAGRAASASIALPGMSVSDNLAQFDATEATLKNEMIRAITGAAMGVEEEKRILSQLPTKNDKPNVWRQKLAVSMANLDRVERYIMEAAGGGDQAPPARAGGPGARGAAPGPNPFPRRGAQTTPAGQNPFRLPR